MPTAPSAGTQPPIPTANARPTKAFFIEMLVKDIELHEAVLELVDNCVDGARRLRGEGSLSGLFVRVKASETELNIQDNCGGIPAHDAINYAFRFGRDKDFPELDAARSVGVVGVGMKRAFFKLGKKFRVESRSERDTFAVAEDVDHWKAHDEWSFSFDELRQDDPPRPEEERGTTISVTDLEPTVADRLGSDAFAAKLAHDMRATHELAMANGLSLSLNGVDLTAGEMTLLRSDHLRPALHKEADAGVTVTVYAGIAESSPRSAGWYVYCNGRMVLEADHTSSTGWGGESVPHYHNQFARFRGYAFLEADDPSLLPWKTTKSDLDADSRLYRALRQRMVQAMRPVIDFLNHLDKEKDSDSTALEDLVNSASPTALTDITEESDFAFDVPIEPGPVMQRISYKKPKDQVDVAKEKLGVTTNKHVGERTFEYYYTGECED